MENEMTYTIGLKLVSSDFDLEFEDGDEVVYDLTKEQYDEWRSMNFEDVEQMDDWLREKLEPYQIYEPDEYTKGLVYFDWNGFDYTTQEYFSLV